MSTYGFIFNEICTDPYGPLSALSYTNLTYLTAPTSNNHAQVTLQILSLNPNTGSLTTLNASSVPTYNSTTGICSNVLQYLNLTFLYTGGDSQTAMTLAQVEISIVVTSLSRSDPSFKQFVRTGFVLWQPPSVPALLTQQLSGTPGYHTGFPLLVSRLMSPRPQPSISPPCAR